MNEPIDVQGVWWLPETPQHKVAGWLTYDMENGGELRLAGSLRAPEWVENRREGKVIQRFIREPERDQLIYPRIHGQSGRRIFHLDDSFRIKIDRHLCREDDSAEKIHVNWLLTGAWFDGTGPVEFDKAIVRFQHLTDWVDHTGLQIDSAATPDAPFAVATATTLPPFRAAIDGGDLVVWQQLSTSGDGRNDFILKQNWALTISATETRPLDFFTDRVSDFQDLLTIATGKVANIETFHFTHNDVRQLSLAGTPIGNVKEKLAYYSRWSNRDKHDDRLSPHAMVFTFDDLGGIDGVQRWMQFAASYRSELSRVMATRYNDQMFLEDRVTNCVAALESFDRTRRRDADQGTYLVERLRNCVSFAGAPFTDVLGGESVEDWTKRAKDHRNTLGHHKDAFRNDTGIIERELGDQLQWLAALCFLRHADAARVVFDKVGSDSNFKWIADRASARRQSQRKV
ncbi:MAG: hypothetical protein L0H31_06790 [Nocardioidaceae bacterium]|nr:hypothetical protein [Nocardioidaceae bacterium]